MKKTTIFDYFFRQDSSNALGGAGSPSTLVSGHNHGSQAIRLMGHPGYRIWTLITIGCLFLATPAWSADILRGQRNSTPAAGGGSGGGAVAPGSVPNSATAQALAQAQAQAAARASDTLRRSTQSLAAQRAAQAAARQAALSGANNLGQNPNNPALTLPDVPDGLATGGLVPDSGLSSTGVANPVITWTGANTPVQSTTTSGQIKVTVQQTQQQALLQWDTFNIGKNTNLDFDQSAGGANVRQWIAFNKINDPSQNPSQILGSITSQGQVYAINRNGIIFGGSSQVNTGSLVASSLPINDNLIERGLLNNPDNQFMFSDLTIPQIPLGEMPIFQPDPSPLSSGRSGDIMVQEGAIINSPSTTAGVGGKVALVGYNVTNRGTISTPDGQSILASGRQVALLAHDTNDPSIRGLDIYLGAADEFSGVTKNVGIIEAARGNISLAGKDIHQNGALESSTSVAQNGTIRLQSAYNSFLPNKGGSIPFVFNPQSNGIVTFGPDSTTRILPETGSAKKIAGSELSLKSSIEVSGLAIHLQGDVDSAAIIQAPSADVFLKAGQFLANNDGSTDLVQSAGQVYLDPGAIISVAGSQNVEVSSENNIVAVELRGPQLADSPLQRDGVLRGETVFVDIRQSGVREDGSSWVGTPLADASGYVGLVERGVGELTITGGSINISAGESVILGEGSQLDVSGGWVNYLPGSLGTTKLYSAGNIYDIAEASRDIIYDGIVGETSVTSAKWGITQPSSDGLQKPASFNPGYTFGGDAGSVSITSPAMALDGDLHGEAFAGPRQRTIAPLSGKLSLSFRKADGTNQGLGYPAISPTPPEVVFRNNPAHLPVNPFQLNGTTGVPEPINPERGGVGAEVAIDTSWINENGFGRIDIRNEAGNVTVPLGSPLNLGAYGALRIDAANIVLADDIYSAGGDFDFVTANYSPFDLVALGLTNPASTPPPINGQGTFTLLSGATLSTAGTIADERIDGEVFLSTKGGSITINSYNANLGANSVLDVSGGLKVSTRGALSYGDAGSLEIFAGRDTGILSLLGGRLDLGSTLKGFSGNKNGGSLTVLAPLIQIGGSSLANGDGQNYTLWLQDGFFSEGGFTEYNLRGLGLENPNVAGTYLPAVLVVAGTEVSPLVRNYSAKKDVDGYYALEAELLPELVRAPVNLTLQALGVSDFFNPIDVVSQGDLVLQGNTLLRTEKGGSITLFGNSVDILGDIDAPAGSITIRASYSSAQQLQNSTGQAQVNLHIGPESRLTALGAVQSYLSEDKLVLQRVLGGGTISLSGNIAAESGALLDVSGTNAMVSLLSAGVQTTQTGKLFVDRTSTVRLDSSGGAISLDGSQMLFVDSTLRGAAGGASASGGTLSVASGRYRYPTDPPETPLVTTLVVTSSGPTITAPFYSPGESAIGKNVRVNPEPETGHFAIDRFDTVISGGNVVSGGFNSLVLDSKAGVLEFSGAVVINALNGYVSLGNHGIVRADPLTAASSLNVNAAYIKIGRPFERPIDPNSAQPTSIIKDGSLDFFVPPTYGDATVTLKATELVDIGSLTLQGVGLTNIQATGADIRGNGILDVAGDLNLVAAQIYPTTANSFTIAAYDHGSVNGRITISKSGTRNLPFSVGGTLNVFASEIVQGGALYAPYGTINLGSLPGSEPFDILSGQIFNATEQLSLTAGSIVSVSGLDPITGKPVVLPYGVNLNGVSWIDVNGKDITAGGLTGKSITLSAEVLSLDEASGSEAASTIDLQGGGDLFAYQWIPGLGGSTDILADENAYAIIPGYGSAYAPYAPYTDQPVTSGLGSDAGYTNGNLQVGDQIYLKGGNGLAEGNYTLLPARYALMKGAYLVKTQSSTDLAVQGNTLEGSLLVSGYRFNGLDGSRSGTGKLDTFELLTPSVINGRSEYKIYSANSYLKEGAVSRGLNVPRLPQDAGQIILTATNSMNIGGRVKSDKPEGGLGSLVDIASPTDIVITGASSTPPVSGQLALDSDGLSNFGADSLLIGGLRRVTAEGVEVDVSTGNLTLDNSGSTLFVSDLVLVAKDNLIAKEGSKVEQRAGAAVLADTLLLGDPEVTGSGDGVLIRVSSDTTAGILRRGVSSSPTPYLEIGDGVVLSGNNVILDSTAGFNLSSGASFGGEKLSLSSSLVSILMDNPGASLPTTGLILEGTGLNNLLLSASELSLLSYSSLDFYGTGVLGNTTLDLLSINAGEIRGFNTASGSVDILAEKIVLSNQSGRSGLGPVGLGTGTLSFDAQVVELGVNTMELNQFATVEISASRGVYFTGIGRTESQADTFLVNTPRVTGAAGAERVLASTGSMQILDTGISPVSPLPGGLGASLEISGESVLVAADVVLPSGRAVVHATNGDVNIDGLIDVRGTERQFYDTVRYTDGGAISLRADDGDINLTANSRLDVSSPFSKSDAGTISISASQGVLTLSGELSGQGGSKGTQGVFNLDVATLLGGAVLGFDSLNSQLQSSGFLEKRDIRVRNGNVDMLGQYTVRNLRLSTDDGDITVYGGVNASGKTGGSIALMAGGSVILENESVLDVSGEDFAADGKGGQIFLEAGAARWNGTTLVQDSTGWVEIRDGSTLELGVNAHTPLTAALDAEKGKFTGTLRIRAAQSGADIRVAALEGDINDASSIQVEGYRIYQPASGNMDTIRNTILVDGQSFLGVAGTTTPAYAAMRDRLLGSNTALETVFSIVHGAEVVNPSGDLTIGTATSGYTSDWDLSTFRFGPDSAPGVLTIKATGDITFFNALSDGFDRNGSTASQQERKLWTAPLLAHNPLLPTNAQSWSYRIVSGSDLTAADYRQTERIDSQADGGSFRLGKEGGNLIVSGSNTAQTSTAVAGTGANYRYSTVRTGSGDIDIHSSEDILFRNPFATVYSAGVLVSSPTVLSTGSFDLPVIANSIFTGAASVLGSGQQTTPYVPQWSMAGGDVTLAARGDIRQDVRYDVSGNLNYDPTSKQTPVNWLYRRGYVAPNGDFGANTGSASSDIASTTWWVDFTNFFQGVATMGGGDVSLAAGRDVANIDASVATNARMPKGTPDADKMIELGGGDLTVSAGRDIDGGIYYVERGDGHLQAGRDITTNATRSPTRTSITGGLVLLSEKSWLPTTLFLGKGNFDVEAKGDLLLGPTVNTFLMPGGLGNSVIYKTYFSTYASDSSLTAASLTGDVTFRTSALADFGASSDSPVLFNWYQNVSRFVTGNTESNLSNFQPWLRLNESDVSGFTAFATVLPPKLEAVSFGGDINLAGDINLYPSSTGSVDLFSSKSINGLQGVGLRDLGAEKTNQWSTSVINLSDADPESLPGIGSPVAYRSSLTNNTAATARTTNVLFFDPLNAFLAESGATSGPKTVLQTKQTLHSPGPLHLGDDEPVRLYAGEGDISGLTLFSGKLAQIFAGRDIGDIAFYIQNVSQSDVSVISAGRDIIPYNPQTLLRLEATSAGNGLNAGEEASLPGDIQISGPGLLQVLAGRHLNLGQGPDATDGTSLGIVSIGNARNPSLPFAGASITVGAGFGAGQGLENSNLDFEAFVSKFIDPATAGEQGERYLPELGKLLGLVDPTDLQVWTAFQSLSEKEQASRSLDIFYLVLRNAGRDYNNPDSPYFQNYDNANNAIAALFPGTDWLGDVTLASRTIKTANGGDINISAPGGSVTVGFDVAGENASDEGIITEGGGNISIFTQDDINVGASRIFTLRGGNAILYADKGNIAAGSGSKTVSAAPPTRVLIDSQSGDVQTDLAGLATGAGIGVLVAVEGVEPGDVDLIAPSGSVDAGDAGIRSSGNINIAAVQVLNAGNISVGGASAGVPVSAPSVSVGSLSSASSAAAGASSAAADAAKQSQDQASGGDKEVQPSLITVEVIGYGGGDGETDPKDQAAVSASPESVLLSSR
jgi:filamentous hemagglutinin